MELKYQVCSLEIAKKLKELGVAQDSLCSWKPHRQQLPTMTEAERLSTQWTLYSSSPTQQDYAAFTASEIKDIIGSGCTSGRLRGRDKYICEFDPSPQYETWGGVIIRADTEPDACAHVLIFLLEKDRYESQKNDT